MPVKETPLRDDLDTQVLVINFHDLLANFKHPAYLG